MKNQDEELTNLEFLKIVFTAMTITFVGGFLILNYLGGFDK